MSLQLIVKSIAALPTVEIRDSSNDYLELVFFAANLPQWEQALTQHLGAPAKPPGTAPSADDKSITKNYGGVQKNQTLFRGPATMPYIAMLWPWQDGEHITLKVAKIAP